MWLTIFVAVILGYYVYQLEKRLRSIEETRGPGYSHWFSINASEALSKNKKFMEMIEIKSGAEGKDYDEWTKAEKDKWGKYPEELMNRLRVTVTYLASENAYFVSTFQGTPRIIHRDDIKTNGLIYSAVVAGDEQGIKTNMEFDIYERLLHKGDRREWVITPCIRYNEGIFKYDTNKFEALCDFPHFSEKKDDELEKLGFKIEREGGDDIYEDPFGEKHSIPTEIKYKKNGVEIRYVY